MSDLRREQSFLESQYRQPDNLGLRRRTHVLYEERPVDWQRWVLGQIPWHGSERVIDVGCGDGSYIQPVLERTATYVAGDLSYGMVHSLAGQVAQRTNLNAQALPFVTGVADVLLANHMLYHVPEQDEAVAEFARVLRPGGWLLAATNSANNMGELRQLLVDAFQELVPNAPMEQLLAQGPTSSFSLENGGALLQRHFQEVQRHDLPGALVFPEPQPVIDYISSGEELYAPFLPAGFAWSDAMALVRKRLERHIAEHGAFRVSKLTGVFTGRNGV